MPSLPNLPNVDVWFRRLDAAWKRMPAEERTQQREEVQQHLEGLVAAKVAEGESSKDAWSADLAQFGDPTRIGHKIYREWCQSRIGLRADLRAIAFGLGLCVINYCLVELLFVLPLVATHFTSSQQYFHWNRTIAFYVVLQAFYYGGAFLIYSSIGHRYPFQAIKAALFTFIFSYLFAWVPITVYLLNHHVHFLPATLMRTLPLLPLHLAGLVVLSYLASVNKRGWYRPTLDDFKLTLRTRRRQEG